MHRATNRSAVTFAYEVRTSARRMSAKRPSWGRARPPMEIRRRVVRKRARPEEEKRRRGRRKVRARRRSVVMGRKS
jgi:hypothetical protein